MNDVWHEVGSQNGVAAPKYELIYSMLLQETLDVLPQVRLMVLEPFVLPGRATDEHWDYFRNETALRAQAAKRVADAHNAKFVPLQQAFENACKKAPAAHWLSDGVHPTPAGHQLIADIFIKALQ